MTDNKVELPAGWGGPVLVAGGQPRPVRPIERAPTDAEQNWYAPIGMALANLVDVCAQQRSEYSDNLIFIREHCRAAVQAYAFGEEAADVVLRYTRSVIDYFGMPSVWRMGFLGVVAEAIATAVPRDVPKQKGEKAWMANNTASLVEYLVEQGLTQAAAIEAALVTLGEMGLPNKAKVDTVKRWHQQYRASLGREGLAPGRRPNSDFPPT